MICATTDHCSMFRSKFAPVTLQQQQRAIHTAAHVHVSFGKPIVPKQLHLCDEGVTVLTGIKRACVSTAVPAGSRVAVLNQDVLAQSSSEKHTVAQYDVSKDTTAKTTGWQQQQQMGRAKGQQCRAGQEHSEAKPKKHETFS